MQPHTLRRLVAGSLAGVLATASVMQASAAGPKRDGPLVQGQAEIAPEYTKIVNKKLISTSFQGDSDHYSVATGFTPIGTPIKFNCAKACTVVVQTMVQVQHNSAYWAICPTIDGVDAIQGCNWQGISSSTTSTYVTGNGTYFWSLAAGQHTLQAQVYFSVAGGLDNWGMTVSNYQ